MKKEENVCPYCGRDMIFEDKVCPYCGKEIKRPSFRKILIWVIAILILAGPVLTLAETAGNLMDRAAEFPSIGGQFRLILDDILSVGEPDHIRELREQYPQLTKRQAEAMEEAIWYTENMGGSESSVVEYLNSCGYRSKDAQAVVNALVENGLDWQQQAALCTANYLEYSRFSREGLIEQLESYDGFTHGEAVDAVDSFDLDWNLHAVDMARSYLEDMPYSEAGLAERMEEELFTQEEIQYVLENLVTDWKENALKMAESYLEFDETTEEELYDILQVQGFSEDQILYAMERVEIE